MTSSNPAARFKPSRHILAAALCPLAAGPLAAALGWDATEGAGSFNVIWLYVRTHVLLAYIAAAPAIPIMWMLLGWTRVRPQSRVIIPLLTTMFALSATIAFASPGAGVVSLPQGLLIAVTYCLVAGTPWSAPKP